MIQIIAMLYAGNEGLDALHHYERTVMPLLREHGGKLLMAIRPDQDGHDEPVPDEIHVLEFPDPKALAAYRSDPRMIDLADLRRRSIAKSVVYVASEQVDY